VLERTYLLTQLRFDIEEERFEGCVRERKRAIYMNVGSASERDVARRGSESRY
jgi:hypothetical protein